MAALRRWLTDKLEHFRRRGRRWRIVGYVRSGDQIPETLPERGAVVVGSRRRATWMAFDCPCKSQHRIVVNLNQSRRPYWRIEQSRPLTIWPSIDTTLQERRCHFVLRRGQIQWIPNPVKADHD